MFSAATHSVAAMNIDMNAISLSIFIIANLSIKVIDKVITIEHNFGIASKTQQVLKII
jgi:hypothetical protein